MKAVTKRKTKKLDVPTKLEKIRNRIRGKKDYAKAQWLIFEYCQCLGLTMAETMG